MNEKIGIIASDDELKESIIELFEEDVKNNKIIIDILDPNNMERQGVDLQKKGVKAIVARSGGYRHSIGTVNVPVIHLEITTIDILQSIKRAKKYMKDIVLVIWEKVYFNYPDWEDIISTKINIEKFKEKDEIKGKIEKYLDKKDDIVIVGSGIACSIAKEYGMDKVFLNASKESIYETINYAKELINTLYEEKYNSEILKTILQEVHDAIIAINFHGKIILYNEMAKELLKKDASEVIGRNIIDVFPQLEFIYEVLKNKVEFNGIKVFENLTIAANASIIDVEGNIEGALCSFQDITKLQKLEKKIRYELNKKGLYAKYKFEDIIHVDPIMKETIVKAKKIGKNDSTVIIYGESGTGKEMIAQSMHNISRRNDSPFVAVNCVAISETLLESELFGYEEGAFTGARKGGKPGLFELAHGGTIFLDEINSISLNLQAKLLRVLEEKEIMRIGSDYVVPLDVRIIAAANEELKRKVEDGSFRSDLFYRLSILELNIPPLRERGEDIIPLFEHYIIELSNNTIDHVVDEEIKEKLINHSWPGNVRELRNVARRYSIFGEIDIDDSEITKYKDSKEEYLTKRIDLKEINRFIEKKVIDMLLKQGMTKSEVAEILGISRTALWKKLNK